MVAGIETTATNLSGPMYHLCKTSQAYNKVVPEILYVFETSSEIALGPPSEMVYLNAVLKKGLRIHVLSDGGLTRIVPLEGAGIRGDFVPGRAYVTMNHNPAYKHPLNFARPTEFLPERWISTHDPRYTSDRRDVYEPFSYEPRNCAGKK